MATSIMKLRNAQTGEIREFSEEEIAAMRQQSGGGMTVDNMITNDMVSQGVLPQDQAETYQQPQNPAQVLSDSSVDRDQRRSAYIQILSSPNVSKSDKAIAKQIYDTFADEKDGEDDAKIGVGSTINTVLQRFNTIHPYVTGWGVGSLAKYLPFISAETRQYEDLRKGISGTLKELVGESGVLTDEDIKRIVGLLPDPGETDKKNELSFIDLKKFLDGKGFDTEGMMGLAESPYYREGTEDEEKVQTVGRFKVLGVE